MTIKIGKGMTGFKALRQLHCKRWCTAEQDCDARANRQYLQSIGF